MSSNLTTAFLDPASQKNQSRYENDTTTIIISSSLLSTSVANAEETTNGSQILTTETSYTNSYETTSIRGT